MAAEKVGWSRVGAEEELPAKPPPSAAAEPQPKRCNRWRACCLCSWVLFAVLAALAPRPGRPSCEELPYSWGCDKYLPVKHACDFIAQTNTEPVQYLICTGDPRQGGIDYHMHKRGNWSSITTIRLYQALEGGDFCRRSPGPHYIDFGSNIGPFVLYVARLGCEVLAIDGSDVYLTRLTASAALNGVSDRISVKRVYLEDADAGSTDYNYEKLHFSGVPVRTIDSIMGEEGLMSRAEQFPLLKIDIEESIAVALRGAKETFRRHLAKRWNIEYWPAVDADWVVEHIVNQGYGGLFINVQGCNASCEWTAGNGEGFKQALEFLTRNKLWKRGKNADVTFISKRDLPIE